MRFMDGKWFKIRLNELKGEYRGEGAEKKRCNKSGITRAACKYFLQLFNLFSLRLFSCCSFFLDFCSARCWFHSPISSKTFFCRCSLRRRKKLYEKTQLESFLHFFFPKRWLVSFFLCFFFVIWKTSSQFIQFHFMFYLFFSLVYLLIYVLMSRSIFISFLEWECGFRVEGKKANRRLQHGDGDFMNSLNIFASLWLRSAGL